MTAERFAHINVNAVSEGLDVFIYGNQDVKGLQGNLDDIRDAKAILQATSNMLGFVEQIGEAAGLVQNVSTALQSALVAVEKLANLYFGPTLNFALDAIDKGLKNIESSAKKLQERIEDITEVTGRIQATIDQAVKVIEEVIEARIVEYIEESLVLRGAVDRLNGALEVMNTERVEITLDGDFQNEVHPRLAGALLQLEHFASLYEEGDPNNSRGHLEDAGNNIPGHTAFSAVAAGKDALGGTVDLINGAADIVEDITGTIGFLSVPAEIVSIVIKPIEPLLNATGFIFNLVVAPVINKVLEATGIQGIVDDVVGEFADFLLPLPGVGELAANSEVLQEEVINVATSFTQSEDEFNDALSGAAENVAFDEAGDTVAEGVEFVNDIFHGDFLENALAPVRRQTVENVNRLEGEEQFVGDVIFADVANRELIGTDGDDIIVDDDGDVTIEGGAGDDVFIMGNGVNQVDGGEGDDFAVFTGAVIQYRFSVEERETTNENGETVTEKVINVLHLTPDGVREYQGISSFTEVEHYHFRDLGIVSEAVEEIVQLEDVDGQRDHISEDQTPGNEGLVLAEGEAIDIIFGSEGANRIETGQGNDFVTTGGGADIVLTGDGDDVVQIKGGEHLVDGGAGRDLLSAVGNQDGVEINLALVTLPDERATQTDGTDQTLVGGPSASISSSYATVKIGNFSSGLAANSSAFVVAGSETESEPAMQFLNFEDVRGGAGDDTITGNDIDNAIVGGNGDDIIGGEGGTDHLVGGLGDDTIDGGTGTDILIGGLGNDRFIGLTDRDEIDGGDGRDTLDTTGQSNTITLDLTGATEQQNLVENVEVLLTGVGADDITAGDELDQLHTGAGSDRVALVGGDTNGVDVDTGADADHVVTALNTNADINLGTHEDTFVLHASNAAIGDAEIVVDGAGGDDRFITAGQGVAVSLVGEDGTLKGFALDIHGERAALEVSNFSHFDLSDFGDRIEGARSVREIHGNGGNDIIDVSQNALLERLYSIGDDQFSTLVTGGAGDDVLKASTAGATFISGGIGNDVLDGTGVSGEAATGPNQTGVDGFHAGAGDDLIRLGGAGNQKVLGGDGTDSLDFSGATSGVTANLSTSFAEDAAGTFTVTAFTEADVAAGAHAALTEETFSTSFEIENLFGSDFGDTLTGTADANILSGRDGDDTIFALDGDDTVDGGDGDDDIHGGLGDDVLSGGLGSDILRGEEGADLLMVGTGVFEVADSFVTLDGGANGADNQGDTAFFNSENGASGVVADLSTGEAVARINGRTIASIQNVENLTGTTHDDVLRGDAIGNLILGIAGDNLIDGQAGNDTLVGGADDDTIEGGAGDDVLVGGGGENVLSGGEGDDLFLLDAGLSKVSGGAGTDVLELQKIAVTIEAEDGSLTEVISDFDLIEENGGLTVVHFIELDGVPTELARAELAADVEEIHVFEPIVAPEEDAAEVEAADRGAPTVVNVAERLSDGVIDSQDVETVPLDLGAGEAPVDTTADYVPDVLVPSQVVGSTIDRAFTQTVALDDGGWVVIFGEQTDDDRTALHAQKFSADGQKAGDLVELGFADPAFSVDAGRYAFDALALEGNLVAIAAEEAGQNGRAEQRVMTNVFDFTGSEVVEVDGKQGSFSTQRDGAFSPTLTGSTLDNLELFVAVSAGGFAAGLHFADIGQTFDGIPSLSQQKISGFYANSNAQLSSTRLTDGNTVVLLDTDGHVGSDKTIFRIFDEQGNTVKVGSFSSGDSHTGNAEAIALANGNWLLVVTTIDSDHDIRARIVDAQGNSLTSSLHLVQDNGNDHNKYPDVVPLPDGGFLVFHSDGSFSNNGFTSIQARRYDAQGREIGDHFTLHQNLNPHSMISATILANGEIALTFVDADQQVQTTLLSDVRYLVRGTNAAEGLVGTDGDDVIRAFGGNDTVDAGAGHDTVRAGTGNDLVSGGDGDDTIDGGSGRDTISGGAGDDVIQGGDDNNRLFGDAGDDDIRGGGSHDLLEGGTGNDVLHGEGGLDTILGGSGDDALFGGGRHDLLEGGTGNDTLDGGRDTDTLDGGAGDDLIFGGHGYDFVSGGAGNDTIEGGEHRDTIEGGDGDDIIDGGTWNDQLFGDGGNDQLFGGDGHDLLEGGTGNDTLDGGRDTDTLDGGAGDDLIFGGHGYDFVSGGAGNDTIQGGDHRDTIEGGDGDDIIDGGTWNDQLFGDGGNDQLFGGDGHDQLFGGVGDDLLQGGGGADRFFFIDNANGIGNDVITDFDLARDVIDLTSVAAVRRFSDLDFRQEGDNTVIEFADGSITLEGIDSALLASDDFDFI